MIIFYYTESHKYIIILVLSVECVKLCPKGIPVTGRLCMIVNWCIEFGSFKKKSTVIFFTV